MLLNFTDQSILETLSISDIKEFGIILNYFDTQKKYCNFFKGGTIVQGSNENNFYGAILNYLLLMILSLQISKIITTFLIGKQT